MATLTAANAAAGAQVASAARKGVLQVAYGVYDLTSAPSTGDVINMCKVPAGATVIGGFVQAADLDSNATETLDIDAGWLSNGTDAADPDGFGNFGVLTGDAVAELRPVAGIYLPLANIIQNPGYKTFAAETTLTVTITAASATFAAGAIKLVVFYVV